MNDEPMLTEEEMKEVMVNSSQSWRPRQNLDQYYASLGIGVEQPNPWSSRIPAAIAKAESLTNGHDHRVALEEGSLTIITATEVALAKALWELCLHEQRDNEREELGDSAECSSGYEALEAFTEKVESL